MHKAIEMAGERFGSLLAIEELPNRDSSGAIMWKFICDCGNNYVISAQAVKAARKKAANLRTPSCGCYRKEATASRSRKLF